MSGGRRWVTALAAAAVVSAGLAGCGDDAAPVQQVPALTDALARVDAAAVADDDARLRRAVAGLVQVTDDAEQSGDLDDDGADRIRDAAAALLDAADTEPSEPVTTTSESEQPSETTTSSAPSPPAEDDEDEDDDEDDDEGNEGDDKKPKKPEKPEDGKGKQ